jgi:hypothetical protein
MNQLATCWSKWALPLSLHAVASFSKVVHISVVVNGDELVAGRTMVLYISGSADVVLVERADAAIGARRSDYEAIMLWSLRHRMGSPSPSGAGRVKLEVGVPCPSDHQG